MTELKRRLSRALLIILIIFLVGTLGFYTLLENLTTMDALYLTIITLTTVGYGDISPHTNMPADGNPYVIKTFAILLILIGMSTFLYTIGIVTEYFVSGDLGQKNRTRRMQKQIDKLRSHYIVCGAGKTGKAIISELEKTDRPYVVIEQSHERILELKEIFKEMLYIQGDATDDRNLNLAGLAYASGIAPAVNDEKDNLYIVLAMQHRKIQDGADFRIAAKVNNQEQTAPKLLSAGADAVISPYAISGKRMVAEMLNPSVTTFLGQMLFDKDKVIRVEQVTIRESSSLIDTELRSAAVDEKTGLIIMAILPKGQSDFISNPPDDMVLSLGDVFICLGDTEGILKLRKLCRSRVQV